MQSRVFQIRLLFAAEVFVEDRLQHLQQHTRGGAKAKEDNRGTVVAPMALRSG